MEQNEEMKKKNRTTWMTTTTMEKEKKTDRHNMINEKLSKNLIYVLPRGWYRDAGTSASAIMNGDFGENRSDAPNVTDATQQHGWIWVI